MEDIVGCKTVRIEMRIRRRFLVVDVVDGGKSDLIRDRGVSFMLTLKEGAKVIASWIC